MELILLYFLIQLTATQEFIVHIRHTLVIIFNCCHYLIYNDSHYNPSNHLSLLVHMSYFFWSFEINESNTFGIDDWIPPKPVLVGVRDAVLISLSLMNRLNKTKPAIFISFFWFGCSQGINLLPEFLEFIIHISLHIYNLHYNGLPDQLNSESIRFIIQAPLVRSLGKELFPFDNKFRTLSLMVIMSLTTDLEIIWD